jgi:hypothetical protein
VAWLLENFGTGQVIPSFDAQKYSYFLQRMNLADLDIPYHEAARGPYSQQLTFKAGAHAKKRNYWEVRGSNIARRRNMTQAVKAANRVFIDLDRARQLIDRLSKMSKADLGGLATVDFASRAIFERGLVIAVGSIQAYFQSDWVEKAEDPWYTSENIQRMLGILADLGLFEKSYSAGPELVEMEKNLQEFIPQPMLTDFGVYKCGVCGKMEVGYEKENHEREAHEGRIVEWKKLR